MGTPEPRPMPHELHRARWKGPVGCAVVTVSDSRTWETDEGGQLLCRLLEEAGHKVLLRRLVPDEEPAIRMALLSALSEPEVRAVFFTGGTGIAPRDRTVDAVRPLLDAELPGFGELFRWLSFQEIGPAAMLSRALAGRCADTLVFCLPGSPAGVRLAMERLILPELGHAVGLLLPRPAGAGPHPSGAGGPAAQEPDRGGGSA